MVFQKFVRKTIVCSVDKQIVFFLQIRSKKRFRHFLLSVINKMQTVVIDWKTLLSFFSLFCDRNFD